VSTPRAGTCTRDGLATAKTTRKMSAVSLFSRSERRNVASKKATTRVFARKRRHSFARARPRRAPSRGDGGTQAVLAWEAERPCADCNVCSPCPHGKVKYNCADCNPCPHGKRKGSCADCKPCPHGKLKSSCADCNPCPHGKLKGSCADCNPCPHGKLKGRLRGLQPLPAWQAEKQLRGLQALPAWQAERQLRGLQPAARMASGNTTARPATPARMAR